MNPYNIGDRVDVYIRDDVVWTEGTVIRTDGTIKLDSVLSPSMTRVIRTPDTAPAGTHCRFDWRSMLRTPRGIGFHVEVIVDNNEYHPAKILHYTDTTDEVLILIRDKTVLWVDVDSPMMRMGWDLS